VPLSSGQEGPFYQEKTQCGPPAPLISYNIIERDEVRGRRILRNKENSPEEEIFTPQTCAQGSAAALSI